jgi:hypothetical protein
MLIAGCALAIVLAVAALAGLVLGLLRKTTTLNTEVAKAKAALDAFDRRPGRQQ